MQIENQVSSVEQSKKLKELGIIQKVANYFWDTADNQLYRCADGSATDIGCCAAYTVAELGIMLPEFSYSWRGRGVNDVNYACVTSDQPPSDDEIDYLLDKSEVAIKKTEAEARAAKLIQKIESGELTAAEVNARLKEA